MAKALKVEIIGDASRYMHALGQAGRANTGFGSSLARVGKIAALTVGGAGLAGIALTLRAGVKEWVQSTKVAAQTGAVIKSTAGIANVTAKQVDKLSTALMNQSGIDDEVVKTGANMLLTFKNIRNEVGKGNDIFSQTAQAVTDMDVAMSQGNSTQESMAKTSIRVGKALNDPIKGITALSRVGVTFTEAQKKQIKAMVESGNVMGAQKMILRELTSEFGGSAKALGDTLPGQINKLREGFSNLAAHLLTSLLPTFTRVVEWTTAHWPQIEATFTAVFHAIGVAIGGIVTAVQAVIPVVQRVVAAVRANWSQISKVFSDSARVIQDAVNLIEAIWARFGDQIKTELQGTFEFVKQYLGGTFKFIQGLFNVWGGILSGDWSRVWLGLKQMFQGYWQQISAVLQFGLTTLQNIIRTPLAAITQLFMATWHAITALTASVWTTITGAVTTGLTTVQKAVTGGMTTVTNAFTTAWATVRTLTTGAMSAVVGAITGAVGRATSAAKAIGDGIVNGIKTGLSAIVGVVKGGLDAIWGIISNVASLAYSAAKAIGAMIVRGIVDGLVGLAEQVGSKLKSGAEKALHAIDPRNLKPWSPISHWAVLLATELTRDIGAVQRILGSSLTKALTTALRDSTKTAEGAAVKGMNNVGQLIVAAAKKYGVDAKAALAVAMGEGGIKFGAVGDGGHAFGPFQFNNAGGVATGKSAAEASAWANSARGVADALRMMADAGAKGKVGFEAITAIVRNFERPLDPSASIAKAAAAYKTLGPQIATAVTSGTAVVAKAAGGQITAIASLVRRYAPIIGLEQARGVIAGLVQGQPSLIQQAKTGMLAAVAAQKQAVVDAKGAFISAFNAMATAALGAFDAKMAAWKPPAQKLLEKMQLEDQIKQMTAGLGAAVETAEAAMVAAFAKGNVAAIAQAKTDLVAALDAAQAEIAARAQTGVNVAQAALAAAQATGDEGAIEKAKADLLAAQTAQTEALNKGIADRRALVEANLGFEAAQQQKTHDAVIAKQREGLAKQLAELLASLKKHPEEWGKMGAAVQSILASFNTRFSAGGRRWADSFADGIRAGTGAAVAAARALANAVAAIMPHSPAKEGPLAFDVKEAGKNWVGLFAEGLAAGGRGIGSYLPAFTPPAGGMAFAAAGGGTTELHIHVAGSVVTENELVDVVKRGLLRDSGRNVNSGF